MVMNYARGDVESKPRNRIEWRPRSPFPIRIFPPGNLSKKIRIPCAVRPGNSYGSRGNRGPNYFTVMFTPCVCPANSGAYIDWMVVMPLEKAPSWATRSAYSKTYTPFGSQWKKKFTDASFGAS